MSNSMTSFEVLLTRYANNIQPFEISRKNICSAVREGTSE